MCSTSVRLLDGVSQCCCYLSTYDEMVSLSHQWKRVCMHWIASWLQWANEHFLSSACLRGPACLHTYYYYILPDELTGVGALFEVSLQVHQVPLVASNWVSIKSRSVSFCNCCMGYILQIIKTQHWVRGGVLLESDEVFLLQQASYYWAGLTGPEHVGGWCCHYPYLLVVGCCTIMTLYWRHAGNWNH